MGPNIVFVPSAFKHAVSEDNIRWVFQGMNMPDMTDEEYDALDERWTKTTPKVNFSRLGVFAQQRALWYNK